MNGIDWTLLTGIGGFVAVLLGISIKVIMLLKDYEASAKKTQYEQVTIPVDNLKDGVVTLSGQVKNLNNKVDDFIGREKDDHQRLVKNMAKTNHSHAEILNMMKKLDNDHQQIKHHEDKLRRHDSELAYHNAEIKRIERTKADKKKRGNNR